MAGHHALFPGSFDPFTLGHLDLVARASRLFDRVTIAIAQNADKQGLFNAVERAELARAAAADLRGVDVATLDGLVVDACAHLACDVIVRGVRSGSELDYELSMARTNRTLMPRIDTVLLAPSLSTAHISSTLVRQIAALGGDVSAFVPQNVADALHRKFPKKP
ncbi:MAG: pantetheine-phosphate adenylyltransferase [Planctomycetota bacterium]